MKPDRKDPDYDVLEIANSEIYYNKTYEKLDTLVLEEKCKTLRDLSDVYPSIPEPDSLYAAVSEGIKIYEALPQADTLENQIKYAIARFIWKEYQKSELAENVAKAITQDESLFWIMSKFMSKITDSRDFRKKE